MKLKINTSSVDRFADQFDPDGKVKGSGSNDDQIALQKKLLENQQHSDSNEFRRLLVPWCKNVVLLYLLIVMVLFVMNYSRINMNIPFTMSIPDNVFIVVLGTTSANILGLMFIILKGLFK